MDNFLITELEMGVPNGIFGTHKDPAAYFMDKKEVEELDSSFLVKEKLKILAQLL